LPCWELAKPVIVRGLERRLGLVVAEPDPTAGVLHEIEDPHAPPRDSIVRWSTHSIARINRASAVRRGLEPGSPAPLQKIV
jgi:hypothetical protein